MEGLVWLVCTIPAAASVAFFIVSLVFFCRASKACAAGGADADIGALTRKKRVWLAMLIASSVCFAVTLLVILWLATIYIAAIFFM